MENTMTLWEGQAEATAAAPPRLGTRAERLEWSCGVDAASAYILAALGTELGIQLCQTEQAYMLGMAASVALSTDAPDRSERIYALAAALRTELTHVSEVTSEDYWVPDETPVPWSELEQYVSEKCGGDWQEASDRYASLLELPELPGAVRRAARLALAACEAELAERAEPEVLSRYDSSLSGPIDDTRLDDRGGEHAMEWGRWEHERDAYLAGEAYRKGMEAPRPWDMSNSPISGELDFWARLRSQRAEALERLVKRLPAPLASAVLSKAHERYRQSVALCAPRQDWRWLFVNKATMERLRSILASRQ